MARIKPTLSYMSSSVWDYESPCKTIEKVLFQISGPTLEISQVLLKYKQSKDFDQINC